LLDEESGQMQNNLHPQLAPEINLESQRDDAFFAAIIDYLQNGFLPSDKNTAQRVLFRQTISSSKMTNCGIWRI
jgi:hypothetical protein